MSPPPTPFHDPTSRSPLQEEVRAFVDASGSTDEEFDALAARVLARQLRHYPSYGGLAAARGIDAASLEQGRVAWFEVPPMPTSAFAHLPLHIGPSEAVFRSSGTTRDGTARSEHHHSDLALYRRIVDRSFPAAVLAEVEPAPRSRALLSLIPPTSLVGDSSLGFMVDHVMNRWADDRSLYAFDEGRLDPTKALLWLRTSATETDRPVVLTTALALWSVLEAVERESGGRAWPETLRIMETGGFKTERFRLTRQELLHRLSERAGVNADRVVREYGMTELTSQAYSNPEDAPEIFELPPWVRVRTLDPQSLEDVDAGEPGLLAFLDLGNVSSAAYVLTEDLGRRTLDQPAAARRFELLGRARDAQLRGCSLTTEQLLRP